MPRTVLSVVISAIVLAAGTSTRFGATKQLEVVRGKTLVQHAVDAASSVVDEVIVVLGHDADAVGLPSRCRRTSARFAIAVTRRANPPRLPPGSRRALRTRRRWSSSSATSGGRNESHVRALVTAFAETQAEILRLRFRDGPGPALLARPVWPSSRRSPATSAPGPSSTPIPSAFAGSTWTRTNRPTSTRRLISSGGDPRTTRSPGFAGAPRIYS